MIDIENINFDIVSREKMRDWIQYEILHCGLDNDIINALFEKFNISEKMMMISINLLIEYIVEQLKYILNLVLTLLKKLIKILDTILKT